MIKGFFGHGPVAAVGFSCLLAISGSAANVCVGPSATGNGSGSDWSNLKAWSATPVRGETWYLATGSYPGRTFNTAASGSTLITIKKATVADHGGITGGWSDSMGNGQATFTSGLTINSSYWVIDGVVGPLWSTNVADYGFTIVNSTSSPHAIQIFSTGTKLTTITVSHISSSALIGNYEHYFVVGRDQTAGADYVTVSHCFAQEYENHIKAAASVTQTGWVTEYNIFKNTFSSSAYHGEDLNSAYSDMRDWTIRYNWFEGTDSPGTAPTGCIVVLNGPASGNFYIYGNVFKDKLVSDGLVGGIHYIMHGVFYNNTIINCRTPYTYSHWLIPIGADAGNDMTAQNNLVVNTPYAGDRGGSGTISQNAYYNCSTTPTETGIQVLTSNPLVNLGAENVQLAYNTASGLTLASPYNADALGNTRSTWSRGAIEFGTVSTNPVISVNPSSLKFGPVLPNTTAQLTLTVQNVGAGTLAGTASVGLPFSILSGGVYSLGANQSQSVTVRYSPTSAGTNSQTITFTGGGGAIAEIAGAVELPPRRENLGVMRTP